jgi:predicted dehydrogenase
MFNRREFLRAGSLALFSFAVSEEIFASILSRTGKRVGIIGLDTSHSLAFTKSLNNSPNKYRGYKVVAAYPYGSKTIPSATDRIPKYIEEIQTYGVKITTSIQELLKQVDVVLLETNDGRLHLEQAREVFKAKKTVFIDKPLAASYADASEIFRLSEKYKTPFFSSSSLRYIDGVDEILNGKYGKVLGVDAYSPAITDASHPDFFWYGIHGVEMLFAIMGIGCKTVSRTHTPDTDILVGVWEDGRVGTVRGTRSGKSTYGGTVYCENATVQLGDFKGYDALLVKIVCFFDTKMTPFDVKETLEICAFIEAAEISKFSNGRAIDLSQVTK